MKRRQGNLQIDIVGLLSEGFLQYRLRGAKTFQRRLVDRGRRLFDGDPGRAGPHAVSYALASTLKLVDAQRQCVAHAGGQAGPLKSRIGVRQMDGQRCRPLDRASCRFGHARAQIPRGFGLLEFTADDIIGALGGAGRNHRTDRLDFRQPVGEVAGDVRRHSGGLRLAARHRHGHHGDGHGRTRKEPGEPQRRRHSRHAEPRHGHQCGTARHAETVLAPGRFAFRFGAGRWGGVCAHARIRRAGHLGLEQIAPAGDRSDQLALVVAQRGANLPDTLEQAVLADMDVRPDRRHQLVLAHDASRIGRKQAQQVECLRPQLDYLAIGPPQFGALLIEFKSRELSTGPPLSCPVRELRHFP